MFSSLEENKPVSTMWFKFINNIYFNSVFYNFLRIINLSDTSFTTVIITDHTAALLKRIGQ